MDCIIVTGGSRGIGSEICKGLLKNGKNVVYTYKNSDKQAEEFKNLAKENNIECFSYKLDQKDSKEVGKFFEWVDSKFDVVEGIINNAGIAKDNLIMNLSDEEWQEVIDTNLSGPFYMVRAFSKKLIGQRKGFIVNIASTAGIDGGVGISSYAASKGGLIAFSKSMGQELSRFGIRSYIIAPGYIDTEMIQSFDEKKRVKLEKSTLLNRIGDAEEIAALIVFLIREKNYIQNTVIRVDGGLNN